MVGDKLGVCEETKAALKKYIRNQTWQVERIDERGKATSWTLTVRHIIPQAQSIGTFIAWGKVPSGATVTDYDALTILDIGGGGDDRVPIATAQANLDLGTQWKSEFYGANLAAYAELTMRAVAAHPAEAGTRIFLGDALQEQNRLGEAELESGKLDDASRRAFCILS